MDGLARRNTNDEITARDNAIAVPVAKARERLIEAGMDPDAADLAAGITPADIAGVAAGAGGIKAGAKSTQAVTSPVDFDHVIGADYKRSSNGSLKLDSTGSAQPTGGHSLVNGDVRIKPGTEKRTRYQRGVQGEGPDA